MIRFRTLLLAFAALGVLALSQSGRTQTEVTKNVAPVRETKASAETEIDGYYVCKGIDNLKDYTGITVITKKEEVYLVQWMVGMGGGFFGVGIRQGDTLAVSWALPGDVKGVVRGINMYHIEKGPRLVGEWATLPGRGTVNRETLTFLKKLDSEPSP
jgi:hypothetical protein